MPKTIMDRRSKLAEIKLVSKYYPVANYSYPSPMSPTSPTISRLDRCSVGSEGSAPGLIDDRTDSEVSQEDDYQHLAHATELWDSFWQAGGEWRLEDAKLELTHPSSKDEEYRPRTSSHHKRQPSQRSVEARNPSWPLPLSTANTPHKPATTKYSAFPSLRPTPLTSSLVAPAPLGPKSPGTSTVTAPCIPPPRPRRPEALLTPCLRQPGQTRVVLPSTAPVMQPCMMYTRPQTSSGTAQAPKKSMVGHSRNHSTIVGNHDIASRSSQNLTRAPFTHEPQHGPRSSKSTTYLGAARQQQRQEQLEQLQQLQQQRQQQREEPHSVFEEDSDCEASGAKSFFRFHRRSGSDKSHKASAAAQEAASLHKRRNRADTIAVSPMTNPPTLERERKVDVFGRILGRRSR
ncbi:hypothetical protein MY11210_009407 [Beauveria gryllotalpidicola]